MRYAAAFAAIAPPGDILVGRDSRPSGRMLSLAIHAALQAVGRTTIDAGIVATPTAGVLLRHFKAAGAIEITASHNPPPYNGLKLFSADGRVIPATPGREVLQRYRTATPDWLPHDRIGQQPAFGRHGHGPPVGRSGHRRRPADSQVPISRGFGQQPRRRRHFGPPPVARTGLPCDRLGRGARRPVRPSGRADGREPRRRADGRNRCRRRRGLLPGPRRRPPGRDRPVGPLPRRRVHAGHMR